MSGSTTFNIWDGIFPSFDDAEVAAGGSGFNGDVYESRTTAAARECIAALRAGQPLPPFHKQRSSMLPPLVAMLLQGRDRLRVLDLGGGLGIGYMALLESLPRAAERIDYTVVEVAGICSVGRNLFGSAITFLEQLPSSGAYDLIHSSSALQYIEDWHATLRELRGFATPWWLLSDVFAGNIPTFVTLQNYYGSRIRQWFLNFDELMTVIAALGYSLEMRSYVSCRRLDTYDLLPMDNFPSSHRLDQTSHLLLRRAK
jgi:putative methyltransferase (TIGR04325 family)